MNKEGSLDKPEHDTNTKTQPARKSILVYQGGLGEDNSEGNGLKFTSGKKLPEISPEKDGIAKETSISSLKVATFSPAVVQVAADTAPVTQKLFVPMEEAERSRVCGPKK